jgi:hypothetical protein
MRTLNQLRVLQLEKKQKEERKRLSEFAPEMLKMLKFFSDEMKDENPEAHGTIKAVDALIAKVGGE